MQERTHEEVTVAVHKAPVDHALVGRVDVNGAARLRFSAATNRTHTADTHTYTHPRGRDVHIKNIHGQSQRYRSRASRKMYAPSRSS